MAPLVAFIIFLSGGLVLVANEKDCPEKHKHEPKPRKECVWKQNVYGEIYCSDKEDE